MSRRLAIIPARGGSQRLPRKNVLDFHGRPMLAWTVAAALESKAFDRVMVSTEDEEIAAAARAAGADVHPRSQALAADSVRVVDVCLEVLDDDKRAGRSYDTLCCLYATAPLRRSDDILAVLGLLEPGVCDFAMAVTRYAHPAHQALVSQGDGILRPMWPELAERRAEQVGEVYVDNGSTYAANVDAFRRQRSFHGPGLRGFSMPFLRSIDIDDMEDLALARCAAGCIGT